MKLLYYTDTEWEEQYTKDRLPSVEVVLRKGKIQDDITGHDESIDGVSVFVDSHIGTAELDRFPNLKIIATRSTGFDHIDIEEAKKRGIVVVNVPSYGMQTVAEFAFALMLSLSRRVPEAHERVAEENTFQTEGLTGFDLAGKTLGVVGTGRIGAHVAKIAAGFDMKVIAFDPYPNQDLVRSFGVQYMELPQLLGSADIITLHVAYSPDTHHLINKESLKRIKKGAYLINTARGAVVETLALVEALEQGIIAGAGLDVLEEEGDTFEEIKLLTAPHPREKELRTVLANHYLSKHPRVIVTPHMAFNTTEAVQRILDVTIDNIVKFAEGTIQNAVTGEATK